MFAELPKLIDRDFAVGYFLPVAAFIGSSLGLLSAFGLLPLIALFIQADTLIGVTVIGLIAWLGSIALLAANRDITRFMEGYGKYNPVRLIGLIERWRYRRMKSELSKLDEEYRLRLSLNEEFPLERSLKRNRLLRELAERFPDQEQWLLPTAFGNTLRAFEVYSRVMYGFEAIQGWNRLLLVIPMDYRDVIDSAKAQVDFWLNVGLLSVVFVFEYLGVAIYTHQIGSVWLPFAALALALIASYRARRTAVLWGELVKASFDICLGDLHTKLGFPLSSSRKDEREFWTKYSQAIIYRLPSVLPEISQKDSRAEDEGDE